jgi:glutathione S-transferase
MPLRKVSQAHDTHHPIDTGDYYENQKEAAIARAKAYRATRLPKFLGYFQKVLESNPDAKKNGGTYLVGSTTTTADLVLYQVGTLLIFPPHRGTQKPFILQVLDGNVFAFPKRMATLKKSGKYDNVFSLKERVEGEAGIKDYLASGRRQQYSMGIFRHYEELDGDE